MQYLCWIRHPVYRTASSGISCNCRAEHDEKCMACFIAEFGRSNRRNEALARQMTDQLPKAYEETLTEYVKIRSWTQNDVRNFVENFKHNRCQDSSRLAEMVAVVKRANELYNGQVPRLAQICSLWTLLLQRRGRGRLIQVQTLTVSKCS